MSYSLEKIKRKSDGVVLYDYIFDTCDTHSVYDKDLNLIIHDHGFNIGYEEGRGWVDNADYENIPFDNDEEYWDVWNSIKRIFFRKHWSPLYMDNSFDVKFNVQ